VYLLATAATLLVGFCVSRFARLSASPGSLYTYVASTLPPFCGVTAAWGLLLAYLATGASVAGGALYYTNRLRARIFPSDAARAAHTGSCLWRGGNRCLARREAIGRSDAVIELVSVGLVVIVLAVLPLPFSVCISIWINSGSGTCRSPLWGRRWCWPCQLRGFETPPRWAARRASHCAPFHARCCNAPPGRHLFHALLPTPRCWAFAASKAKSAMPPARFICWPTRAGVSPLGVGIDFGAMISMFACVLACTTAAARVLMRMAHGAW